MSVIWNPEMSGHSMIQITRKLIPEWDSFIEYCLKLDCPPKPTKNNIQISCLNQKVLHRLLQPQKFSQSWIHLVQVIQHLAMFSHMEVNNKHTFECSIMSWFLWNAIKLNNIQLNQRWTTQTPQQIKKKKKKDNEEHTYKCMYIWALHHFNFLKSEGN